MSTNQDRAAEVIDNALSKYPEVYYELFGDEHVAITQALADAGLLAHDLPAPDRDGRWWPTASRLGNVNIRGRRVYIHSGVLERMGISFTPDDADDLADILKAAAAAARTHQEKK